MEVVGGHSQVLDAPLPVALVVSKMRFVIGLELKEHGSFFV